jgi:hypothetical protein
MVGHIGSPERLAIPRWAIRSTSPPGWRPCQASCRLIVITQFTYRW